MFDCFISGNHNFDIHQLYTSLSGQVSREDFGKKICTISPSALIIATTNSIIYRSLEAAVPYVSTIAQSCEYYCNT